ncbi:MAG TPA: MMPL family transporter [Candidatus Saccharimonadales bacterium]|nr:MMPL family transporter [Candidatus Saccharimonadales bacterium]
MKRFGEFIVAKRWWVLAFWLIAAVAIVALSPSLSSVESTDQSSFLPKSYESIKAMDTAKQVSPQSQDASDIIVFRPAAGGELSTTDTQAVQTIVSQLNARHIGHVAMVMSSAQQLSPDHHLQLATVLYNGEGNSVDVISAVKDVRSAVHSLTNGTGLAANVTGEVAIGYDSQGASEKALKIVGIGTLLLVLVLPALIFRSPLAGLLPVVAVGIVSFIANALIADAATWFHFKVNQQLSVIFTVVLFGIGTDYILFLLFRYRERLRSGEHGREAVSFALARAGEAILSAALVVLTSFTALFFAKFGIFSSMAPGLVICVAVMMLAALTLVPALVAIVGTKVFWPSKAWQSQSLNPSISKRVGGLVAARPAIVTLVVTAFLVGLSIFALGYKADFSSFSKPPQGTESAAGYSDLLAAFPAGVTNPAQIFVTSTKPLTAASLQPLTHELSAAKGVATVLPATIAPSGRAAMLSVILKDDPYSSTAINNVSGPIRTAAHTANSSTTQVYVGGVTSVFADIQDVTARDLRVLFPIAAVFIFFILAILLRSLVAPIFLLITVGLGYMATLGATTLIFERIGHAPGLIFFIPLFMYLFVVAIGTDYNILTMTRLREEVREGRKPHEAADLTVEHSSATVVSAGLILAATFGSLLLAGMGALSQMGSAVAIGVMLAAFVIAPFLIPSVSAVLGYSVWWPGHRPVKK